MVTVFTFVANFTARQTRLDTRNSNEYRERKIGFFVPQSFHFWRSGALSTLWDRDWGSATCFLVKSSDCPGGGLPAGGLDLCRDQEAASPSFHQGSWDSCVLILSRPTPADLLSYWELWDLAHMTLSPTGWESWGVGWMTSIWVFSCPATSIPHFRFLLMF